MTESKPAGGARAPADPDTAPRSPSQPRQALVDDLFDEGDIAAASQAPLNPAEFHFAPPAVPVPTAPPPAEPQVDAPTERIDLITASDMAPSAAVVAEAHPPFGSEPDPKPAAPAPAAGPQELDLGFPLGSSPPQASAELGEGSGILGLPLGSRPSAVAAPARAPRLPCTVVVIAEARALGGQIAAGLMADGYTCRAATPAEATEALSGEGVQAAVVDLPPDVTTPAQIEDIALALGGWSGPIVWLSESLPTMSIDPGARLINAKEMVDGLTQAIELVRDETLLASAEAEAHDPGMALAPQAAPAAPLARLVPGPTLATAGHQELSAHVVRALMVSREGTTRRGRVLSMSPSGELLVDVSVPPEPNTLFNVELIVVDGQRAELGAKVLRSGEGQALLQLEVPPAHLPLLARFIEEAQDERQPAIEQVRMRERSQTEVAPVDFVDDKTLAEFFDKAAAQLDDDAIQQAFIQACIKAQRLPYAVQCYRELKNDRPEDERVAKYLNQVGTILGFYAFRKADDTSAEDGMPKALKWALGAFVLAALFIWVMVEVLSATG